MKSKLIASVVGVVLLGSQIAWAQDAAEQAGSSSVVAACKTDIDTLCTQSADGRGRFKCLRENEAKVSPGCRTALDAQKAARDAVRSACKADRESLCQDAGDERGAGMRCLRDNVAKVSADCGKALAALPERKK